MQILSYSKPENTQLGYYYLCDDLLFFLCHFEVFKTILKISSSISNHLFQWVTIRKNLYFNSGICGQCFLENLELATKVQSKGENESETGEFEPQLYYLVWK